MIFSKKESIFSYFTEEENDIYLLKKWYIMFVIEKINNFFENQSYQI